MTDSAGEVITAPLTAEDILNRVADPSYRIVKTVPIFLAPHEALEAYEGLLAEFASAQGTDIAMESELPQLAARLTAAEDALSEYLVPFVLGAISKKAWADLLLKHRPTEAQLRVNKRAEYDPTTFPAVAVAASLVSPEFTHAQVVQLEQGVDGAGGLTDAQFNTLFNAACEVNTSGTDAPKSTAVAMLRHMSAASSKPAITTESVDPSS